MGSGRSDIRSPSCLFCSSILSLLEPGPKNLKAVLYYIHISSKKKKDINNRDENGHESYFMHNQYRS